MADVDFDVRRVQAAARLLWDCIGRSCRLGEHDVPHAHPHPDGRAVAFLREHLATASQGWLQNAEMRMRSIHMSPAYAQVRAAHVAQIKAYLAGAPVFWRIARAWIDESPMTAVKVLNQDPVEIGYLAQTLLRYLHGSGRRAGRHGLVSPALYEPRLRDLGGAWHFVSLALAVMLAVRAHILFDIALARYDDAGALRDDIALLGVPGMLERLANARDLWTDEVAQRVDLLCGLPIHAIEPCALELQRQDRLAAAVYAEGRAAAQEHKHEARLAATEVTRLRVRLEQAHRRIEQLDRLLAARSAVVCSAAASQPQLGRNDEADAKLREARRDLEAERAHCAEQEAELLMLREFCALLLEPPKAPAPPPEHAGAVDLREARVIVVGGRERFHQKLRRQLPRGAFVHPDLAACPADVFEHADCVVFCTEYCSHQLVRGAIELTRRHGLRSGYANHTNPDLVLQTVRDILAG